MYTNEEIVKAKGAFTPPLTSDPAYIKACIQEISEFPEALNAFFNSIKPEHQNAQYREGSWTFRQVIHHIADSHMQAFSRFKLALTEDQPIIKPYNQNAWADSPDSLQSDASISVQFVKLLHERWVVLLMNMKDADFSRIYVHPEYQKEFTLTHALGLYAWHGKHHLTQMQRYASNQAWI